MCCALSCFSCVQRFVTPWTVAHQAYPSMGILQAKIQEWVAISSSIEYFTLVNMSKVSQCRSTLTNIENLKWNENSKI